MKMPSALQTRTLKGKVTLAGASLALIGGTFAVFGSGSVSADSYSSSSSYGDNGYNNSSDSSYDSTSYTKVVFYSLESFNQESSNNSQNSSYWNRFNNNDDYRLYNNFWNGWRPY